MTISICKGILNDHLALFTQASFMPNTLKAFDLEVKNSERGTLTNIGVRDDIIKVIA